MILAIALLEKERIDKEIQNDILALLNNHINSCQDILRTDKYLEPMLIIYYEDKNPDLIGLQPESGSSDMDQALNVVLEQLRKTNFMYSIFSYSTQILLDNKKTTALKTYVFTNTGLTNIFFNPYEVKGLFKKSITIDKPILKNTIENIF